MKKIITIAILCLAVLGGFAQSTNSFEYDNLNRLTKVYYANGAVTQYTYDALGNRLTKSVAGVSVSCSIAASVSPTNAGSVSGTGIYQGGSTCTLTASANAGYTFSNWTENGTVVSVAATYSFPVTSDRNLVANFTDANGNGLLSGVFSVSENTQVGFSQGNLQYQASTNTWRFAENQWDYIGADNANASSTYSGWIDLFGWGTSGYNHGAVCYQPWSTSTTSADYYAYGNPSLNLSEGNGLADWGWNGISNGGQIVQSGWRTLSIDEWSYMLFTRPTPSGLRFAKANVEDVNGIILLPDDWSDSNYPLENVNDGEANYTDNSISGYEYGTDLESEGAVFFPVAGSRMGNSINFVEGVYWSATKCANHSAYLIYFNEEGISNASGSSYYRYRGQSVRLVRTIEAATSYTIEATPNPVEGGTVAGAGIYEQGQTCTLTATFNEGYTFTAWTENGEVVSTEATYSFIVEGNRNLVANFNENEGCSIIFNLNDSYGDGYTGNYLVVSYGAVTERLTVDSGSFASYTLQIPDGSHVELSWIMGSYPEDCSFSISYSNGNVICAGNNVSSSLFEKFDVDCVGMPYTSFNVNATANPTNGGVVYGMGEYAVNSICTLTAMPTDGYVFVCWTENGEIVSTETVYGFIVTSNRDIEARFIQPLESMTDDFNDGVIDLALWTNGGSNVYEEAGLMKIEQNETDDYVYLKSVPMLLADDNKIAIDRRFKLHRACDYYYGETNVLLNGDENNYVRVQYFHDSYEGRYGTYMVSQLNGEHTEIYLCDALFDTWVTEHVEIDVSTGTLAYYRDGQFVTSVEVPHLVEQDFAYYNLMFRPFGWWTGHQHYMDWIAVNEDDKCFVSAFAEPSVGGVINGSGLYTQGQTCTLTASPADGYTFMNWTENGAVVSTSPTYIFDVTGHRTLTANFFNPDIIHFADPNVKAICVANWDTNGNGELSYAEAAAVTDIGNVFQHNYDISSFNELQYFIGLTYIGDEAFINSDALISVVIPNSVTSIGNYAFEHCYSLNSIVIPNSVTSIGHRAFSQSNLTSIIIPNSVTSFGYGVFIYCGSLENIEVESGNPVYDSRDNCNAIIETATNTLIIGCKNTVIPNSVTSIGDEAFFGCTGLTSINIPNSVTAIGAGAFMACYNLTSIEIPSSVTSIGYGTVLWCNGLENIVIESSNPVYDSRNNCNAIIETATNTLMAGCMNTIIPNSVTTIGEGAFQSCNNLTSIEIPNSVTSIGQMAFAYCYGLTSITVHSETPPTLEGYVFADVNQEIPILVPCGSVEAYQNAAWGGFSNFVGMCPYEITATANPVAGGTVTGGGTFDAGILCTLTATPNAGYTFGSWTENGETVSTDATYSFTVSGDRTLVANFAPEGNYWTPENTGNYSLTMALTGVIEIDGVEQFSDQLEVGAFCNGVCRGSQMASEFYLTNRYLVMLSIHGEIGDELTFKLYDHGLAQELNLTSPDAVTFTIDGYGTPIEPYALNFISSYEILATTDPEGAGTIAGTGSYAAGSSCTLVAEANDGYQFVNWTLDGVEVSTNATFEFTVTQSAAYVAHFNSVQTQTLAQGWNWWSTYIGQNGSDGLTMLENSLGSNGIRIQSKNNGYVDQFEYNGTSYWYGTLNALTNEQMYMVRTNTPCDATMTGQANVLADHPITINNGWNWIGFPGSESVSVANAMSGFAPEANDQIKSKNNGYSTYVVYGSNALWYGTLNTLEPGQGYMYNSNSGETKTLVYQDGRGETRANVTTEGNMFQPNEADYAHNMTITAIVELGGDELRSDSYELAVFAGNECRGSAKLMYAELLDRYIAFLLVAGEAEENLRFVLTDGRNARWSDDEMKFTIDGVVGSPIAPAIIHFGTLGVEENDGDNIIVYPNPSKNVFNIEGEGLRKVEIVNAYGQLIFTKEIAGDYLQIDLGNRSAGVYMLRVVTEKGIKTQQIIKNN